MLRKRGTRALGIRGFSLLWASIPLLSSLPAIADNGPPQTDAAPPATVESPAPPPSVEQCVEAHERAQILRIDGKLLESRDALRACAHDACPSPLKNECVTWREEVRQQVPTVVFEVLTNRGAAALATVRAGDRELTRTLDGHPLELDPGHYEFTFELPDGAKQVVPAMVKPGDRNVVVSADFRSAEPAASQEPAPVPVQLPPPATPVGPMVEAPPSRVVPTATYVLGGVALASAGAAVALGVSTNTKEQNSLDDCAPSCSRQRVDEITTLALFTDISVGIAVSAAVGAALFYAFSEEEPPVTGTVRPAVSYGPDGAAFGSVWGSF